MNIIKKGLSQNFIKVHSKTHQIAQFEQKSHKNCNPPRSGNDKYLCSKNRDNMQGAPAEKCQGRGQDQKCPPPPIARAPFHTEKETHQTEKIALTWR